MTKILIGADPEFWIVKDGKPVSAHGMVEGTKENPQKLTHGAVQVDGMALEVNINPASEWREFRRNLQSVMKEVRELIPEEYDFSFEPVAEFGKDYIQSQPEEAKELGCQPDFNAYTGEVNQTPDANADFRTAAGHFHIGWCDGVDVDLPQHIEACRTITRELDCTLGILSQLWDSDKKRRELYGTRGAYRPKPYGVEYRVLSCAWMANLDVAKMCFYIIKNTVKRAMIPRNAKYGSPGMWTYLEGGNWTTSRDSISENLKSILPNTGLTVTNLRRELDLYPKMSMLNKNDDLWNDYRWFIGCKTHDQVSIAGRKRDKWQQKQRAQRATETEQEEQPVGPTRNTRDPFRLRGWSLIGTRNNRQEQRDREEQARTFFRDDAAVAWDRWTQSPERQEALQRAEEALRRAEDGRMNREGNG